jgi:hypothetical protein
MPYFSSLVIISLEPWIPLPLYSEAEVALADMLIFEEVLEKGQR